MPRSKEVEIAGRKFTVNERTIKELEAIGVKISGSMEKALKASSGSEIMDALRNLLYEQIPLLFEDISEEDIKEAYPSELEKLVEAFIDLHFFALKRLVPTLVALAQAATKGKV